LNTDSCDPLSISTSRDDRWREIDIGLKTPHSFGHWCIDDRLFYRGLLWLSVCIGSFRLDRRFPRPPTLHTIYDMYIKPHRTSHVISLWDPDFQTKSTHAELPPVLPSRNTWSQVIENAAGFLKELSPLSILCRLDPLKTQKLFDRHTANTKPLKAKEISNCWHLTGPKKHSCGQNNSYNDW